MKHIVTIQRYANNGYGVGFINGKAVFVPYSAVGDVVAIRITKDVKSYSFGIIEEIVSPSPHRILPQCSLFGHCGGCDYLHVSYEHELVIKKELLYNTLTRLGGIPPHCIPHIEILHANRFYYRSHATFQSDGVSIGFYKKDTHCIVPLTNHGCLLLHEAINHALPTTLIPQLGQIKVAVDTFGNICSDPTHEITELEQCIVYKRSLQTFFQANRYLRSTMLHVVGRLIDHVQSFLDVGCGVGFFSIYLAKTFSTKGVGIDINTESIAYAIHNAKENNVDLTFYTQDIERYHPYYHHHDLVILDPPRTGITKKGRKTILAIRPPAIIYVSCNPVTFARDVKSFIDSNYQLKTLYLIDMFPCTHHTEVIGLLHLTST